MSWLFDYPVRHGFLIPIFYPGCPSLLAVLSWLSYPTCPFLASCPSCLSFPGSSAPGCLVLSDLSGLSFPDSPVLAVLSCQSCPVVLFVSPVLAFLSCLSFPDRPVLDALSSQSYPCSVLSWLSCPDFCGSAIEFLTKFFTPLQKFLRRGRKSVQMINICFM